VGRLFIRIFLFFWLGSACLLLGVAIGLWLFEPDIVGSFRYVNQIGMLYVGEQAADSYEAGGESGAAMYLEKVSRDGGFRAWLYAIDGRFLAGPPELPNLRELVTQAIANGEAEGPMRGRLRVGVIARRVAGSSGQPFILVWDAPVQIAQLTSPQVMSIRGVVLVLVGGIGCWWLTRQITKPIRILRTTAAQFAAGDLAVRVSHRKEFRRRDELAELGRDFDYMASRIEALVKSQQQLLADISHELRSPLARLSLALDLARRRLGDSAPEHQRMDREINRLNELIGQLLTIAQLQARSQRDQMDVVDILALVYEVAADASFEAENAGRKVVIGQTCDATVQGSRALLRSALENVVRNAVRHTPQSTVVTIEMERVTGPNGGSNGANPWLRIGVRDRGPGVPPQALDRLFDPFYRVDEGRDRKSGGVGLGLAITRQALLTHGGTATAENHPDGGLVVRLELPLT